jgi:hypothetical protein
MPIKEFHLSKVLDGMEITQEQVIQFDELLKITA